jgi:hypothetical protein
MGRLTLVGLLELKEFVGSIVFIFVRWRPLNNFSHKKRRGAGEEKGEGKRRVEEREERGVG